MEEIWNKLNPYFDVQNNNIVYPLNSFIFCNNFKIKKFGKGGYFDGFSIDIYKSLYEK